ncbi:hypothetical protein EON65_34985 [archaeon]|nr:MAG: hypothetical protein EON65_34985 [archaeon]
MSRVGSDLEDDNLVNKLLQQLAEQAQDCSESLDRFTTERIVVLNNQKRALAEYEEEMRALERLENGVEAEDGV